jgi:hypothetical protein
MCKSCAGTCHMKTYMKKRRENSLKKLIKHAKHHTREHISYMRKLILSGVSFSTAHRESLLKGLL